MARLEDGDYISYIDELAHRPRAAGGAPGPAPASTAAGGPAAGSGGSAAAASGARRSGDGEEPGAADSGSARSGPWASRNHTSRPRGRRPHLQLTPGARSAAAPRLARYLASLAAAALLTMAIITALHIEQPWLKFAVAAAMLMLTAMLLNLQDRLRARRAPR